MLKVYISVIHALLTLTDMHGYHAQLSVVTSDIDMISVVFIRNKLLKLHASMSIHTTGVSTLNQNFAIIARIDSRNHFASQIDTLSI